MPKTTEMLITQIDGAWHWKCTLCNELSKESWYASHALYAIYQNFAIHIKELHTLYATNPGVIR